MTMYMVERLQIQYQFVEADTEEEAIHFAEQCGEWDTESFNKDQDLFYGTRVFVVED